MFDRRLKQFDKIIPVLPSTEVQLLKVPLMVVMVTVYFLPGSKSVKVNSLASFSSLVFTIVRSLLPRETT